MTDVVKIKEGWIVEVRHGDKELGPFPEGIPVDLVYNDDVVILGSYEGRPKYYISLFLRKNGCTVNKRGCKCGAKQRNRNFELRQRVYKATGY